MAMYPGSTPRLIDTKYLSGARMAVFNRVNLHVAVSESSSLYSYFNASGRASSHFYVRRDGTSEQYVDTALQAEADLDGNDATISIETQGGVNNADSEPWTDQQLTALASIFKWAMDTHGIRNQMASTSQTNDSSKGLSWHRLGIDGNFPALPNPCAGRGQRGGGMKYSNSGGKLCPGCAKINQVPEIFARAGGSAPTPQPPDPGPGPTPPTPGGLVVDGQWGAATTTRLQQYLGTQQDGVISNQWKVSGVNFPGLYSAQWNTTQIGSNVIRALQRKIGVADDGLMGGNSIRALQRYLGTEQDGVISTPYSNMVAEMQRRLNANTF